MKRRFLLAVLVLVTLASHAAVAQTRPASSFDGRPVQRTRGAAAAASHDGVDWQRLLVAMVVVVGLIVALRYAAGWLFPGVRGQPGGRAVRVLGRTAIAPRQQVILIHVGRRVLVVGDSAGTLSPLANIDDADEVAELIGRVSGATQGNGPESAGRFGGLFGRAKTDYDLPSLPPGEYVDDAPDDSDDESPPGDPHVAAAQDEIAGILDKMRSITKTIRR